MKQVQTKTADIQYRVAIKRMSGVVVYKVLSSNGHDIYEVTLVNGKVNNCTCPAYKPCYHMTGVAAKEAEFQARRREEEAAAMAELAQEIANESAAVPLVERGSMHRDVKMVAGIPMR